MNYEKRFLEIRDFLSNHQYIHELEMLERFEDKISEPYSSWIHQLSKLSQQELLKIENEYNSDLIEDPSLKKFIKTAHDLIQVPHKAVEAEIINKNLQRKMTAKKVYEVALIAGLLKSQEHTHFIDVGSGAGHLSSVLVNNKRSSVCIDQNANFQKMGKDKLKRWSPETLEKIVFSNRKILSHKDLEDYNKDSMLIGLHSCGALSTSLIQLLPKRILNFGCCYHKISDEYNISELSKKEPLYFTNHAKTSAAKGYSYMSSSEYNEKFQVKRYRYTLHFLLKEKFGDTFSSVCNGKNIDYQKKFSDYAQKFSKKDLNLSEEQLDQYYVHNIDFIDHVIKAGTLRALLARVIELYFILDRVLFLRENGIPAQMFTLFSRKISPRNIAIYF